MFGQGKKDLFLATSSKPAISLPWKEDAETSVMEGNCYLSRTLSHEVIGIDQNIHNDVTSCNETVDELDGNSNLHRNLLKVT